MFKQEKERDRLQKMLIKLWTYYRRSWREMKGCSGIMNGRIVYVLVMGRVLFWRNKTIEIYKRKLKLGFL